MKSFQLHLRSDNFHFVKTEKGDVIRRGQTARNKLILVFLGLVEVGLFAAVISFSQHDPVNWLGLVASILFGIAIVGLMGYILRLQRVPPMRFDSHLKTVIFKQDGAMQQIPFAEIRRIEMSFEPYQDPGQQNLGTYNILAYLTGVRSIQIAQISGIEAEIRERAQTLVALIEEVTGVGLKPVADMNAKMKTVQEMDFGSFNLGMIAQHLGRIQQEGGEGNFVIFEADSRANYFIQFTSRKGESSLYAEAAGNPVIPKNYRLDPDKLSKLQQLGWESPASDSPNYHRQWQASSYDDRLMVAKIVMQTFVEVYGADLEQSLEVNLNLG